MKKLKSVLIIIGFIVVIAAICDLFFKAVFGKYETYFDSWWWFVIVAIAMVIAFIIFSNIEKMIIRHNILKTNNSILGSKYAAQLNELLILRESSNYLRQLYGSTIEENQSLTNELHDAKKEITALKKSVHSYKANFAKYNKEDNISLQHLFKLMDNYEERKKIYSLCLMIFNDGSGLIAGDQYGADNPIIEFSTVKGLLKDLKY